MAEVNNSPLDKTCPAISVIIPVYNSELYLKKCLDSLRSQTFDNWEAICIDDGSTDGCADILKAYALRDPRIRSFTQKNCGQGVARNRGLRETRGMYITFLDSDDYLSVDYFELLYAAAERTGADVVVGSTQCESPQRVRLLSVSRETLLSTFKERIAALPHGGSGDKLYRADWLRSNGLLFSEGVYWEDNIFTVRACLHARRFVTEPSAVYHYFTRETSTTHSPQLETKRKADSLTTAREIMTLFESKECSAEERAAVASFCLRHFITRQHLIDPVYYTGLLDILGSISQLTSMRRKALRQANRRALVKFIKKILSLGICQRVNKRSS